MIAGDDEDREAYKSGLLVLGCILASIFVIWWMVLLVLKCKGKSVGCASGRSFRGERVEPSHRDDSAGSTDMEDEWVSGAETSRGDADFGADEVSFHSSIKSSEVQDSVASEDDCETRSEYSVLSRPTTRERRTQIAFFLFGLLTLASVPLVLTLFFSPLKRAVDASEGYLLQTKTVLSQIENGLNTINIAVDTAAGVVDDIPSTVQELCPSRSVEEIEDAYGIDLDYTASILVNEYERIRSSIDSKLSDIISNKNDFDDLVASIETAHHETETYLWAVPGLMLALTSVTASLLFGVLLAWKRQSNRQAQRTLSYGVLPCLICLSLVCWIVGISSALAVALLSDACTQGGHGNPDAIVERIIFLHGFERNTTTFKVVDAFTTGCNVDNNPTRYVDEVEEDVQKIIDNIWNYILSVDAIGRDDIMSVCGSDSLSDALREAQDIARLLTSIRRALSAISSALQCEDIYPIYNGVLDDAVCTDLATSFSWSMFMFLLLGVSTMCMISLRASWRHKVGEDQIYNEDEVAENMFLDEHEEYLHYISKYKHEWEEYGGINSVVPVTPHRQSMYDETSESEETTGSRTYSGAEPVDDELEPEDTDREQMNYISNYAPQQDAFNPYQTTAPASPSTDASEDISFLSLRSLQTKTPESRVEDADLDIVITPSSDSERKQKKLYSAMSLLRGASAIFRGEKSAEMKSDTVSSRTEPRSYPNIDRTSIVHASSDVVGCDDSSLVSINRIRTSASEGGSFSKIGWRSRTDIEQLSAADNANITSILGKTTLRPRPSPSSARSKSEYSL